jgi:hypothetical protein
MTKSGGHTIKGKMAARARTIESAALIIFSDTRTSADSNLAATQIAPTRHPAQLMLRLGFPMLIPRQSPTSFSAGIGLSRTKQDFPKVQACF